VDRIAGDTEKNNVKKVSRLKKLPLRVFNPTYGMYSHFAARRDAVKRETRVTSCSMRALLFSPFFWFAVPPLCILFF
jgi:hypothetical protein